MAISCPRRETEPWFVRAGRVGKPDSVPAINSRGQRPFVWSDRCRSDRCDRTRESRREEPPSHAAAEAAWWRILLFGLAPDGVCPHPGSRRGGASSYLALSPLPDALSSLGRFPFCGTFPRSLGAAVSGHPALRSPDFPLLFYRLDGAVVRPSPPEASA